VHIKALPAPRFAASQKILSEVVARAFNQRRKMLRASLKGLVPEVQTLLEGAGIDPQRRAETVNLEEFCRLSEAVRMARTQG
jgi:16S rRNA (adenine1518-N6/adenine1519-N6)-dimethyltransferase